MARFTNGKCSSTPEERHSPSDSIGRNSPKVFYTSGPRIGNDPRPEAFLEFKVPSSRFKVSLLDSNFEL
jgi:hypothetical protein